MRARKKAYEDKIPYAFCICGSCPDARLQKGAHGKCASCMGGDANAFGVCTVQFIGKYPACQDNFYDWQSDATKRGDVLHTLTRDKGMYRPVS